MVLAILISVHFTVDFRISLWIPTKRLLGSACFDQGCTEFLDQFFKNWHHNNMKFSIHKHDASLRTPPTAHRLLWISGLGSSHCRKGTPTLRSLCVQEHTCHVKGALPAPGDTLRQGHEPTLARDPVPTRRTASLPTSCAAGSPPTDARTLLVLLPSEHDLFPSDLSTSSQTDCFFV